MTLLESTSNNVVFVFNVFVSLSVSKFVCDVFHEFYFEIVWYRSFLFVCERCLILSSYSGVIQTLTVLHKRLTMSILLIAL